MLSKKLFHFLQLFSWDCDFSAQTSAGEMSQSNLHMEDTRVQEIKKYSIFPKATTAISSANDKHLLGPWHVRQTLRQRQIRAWRARDVPGRGSREPSCRWAPVIFRGRNVRSGETSLMKGSEGEERHEIEAAAAVESWGNICRKSAPVVKSSITGELARLCSGERSGVSAAEGLEKLKSA